MKFERTSGVQGEWVKKTEVVSGSKVKIVNECVPITREFNGVAQTQNVAKVRFQGAKDAQNLALNKPTINALIAAFGDDSKQWIGHVLTAHTEKVVVAGKRGTSLYLVPEGYKVSEDEGGYVVIQPEQDAEKPAISADDEIKYPEEDINPDDIPW